jgi:hypothetical protein
MVTPLYASAQELPLLTTKLYIPPPRSNLVSRSRLTQRLDEELQLEHKRIPISALLIKRVETEEAKSDEGRFIS